MRRNATPSLHPRDHRVSLLLLLILLVFISTATSPLEWLPPAVMTIVLAIQGRTPLWVIRNGLAAILPFTAVFCISAIFTGNAERALILLVQSLLSGLALIATIHLAGYSSLLSAAKSLGLPGMVLEVAQLIPVYLTTLRNETQRMAIARKARGASRDLRAAAGGIAVLFAKTFGRAERLHQAMLARGFDGTLIPANSHVDRRLEWWPLLAVTVMLLFSRWAMAAWIH